MSGVYSRAVGNETKVLNQIMTYVGGVTMVNLGRLNSLVEQSDVPGGSERKHGCTREDKMGHCVGLNLLDVEGAVVFQSQ